MDNSFMLTSHDELQIMVERLKLDNQQLKQALIRELGDWTQCNPALFRLINNIDSIITDWEDHPDQDDVSTLLERDGNAG